MRLPDSLRALRHRDLQLFFGGQAISLCGTWMQSVAQGWLVYRLWHRSELLGWVGFLGQIPVFLLGAWAGSLADRLPRRRMVLTTQTVAMVQAGLLAFVTLTGTIQVWQLLALAAMLGTVNAFDIPSRQSYLTDMAGPDLENAIAFNSTLVNLARVVGPAIGGYVVAWVGEGMCFLLNSVSYIAVIGALYRTRTVSPRDHVRGRSHLADGLSYVWTAPHIRTLLLLVAFAALTCTPYAVLMPVFARDVFQGGATLQGRLMGAAGIGASLGAMGMLRAKGIQGMGSRVALGASTFAIGLLCFAAAPNPTLAFAALVLAGWGFMSQNAGINLLVQRLSPPEMRGRVMGLYSMAFVGMSPFGSLMLGQLAAHLGPRGAVATGASCLLLASIAFRVHLPRLREQVRSRFPDLFPEAAPAL